MTKPSGGEQIGGEHINISPEGLAPRDDFFVGNFGEHPGAFAVSELVKTQKPPELQPRRLTDEEHLLSQREQLKKNEIIQTLADIKERSGFQEINKETGLVRGVFDFVATKTDKVTKKDRTIDYDTRLQEAVDATGKESAASYGLANFEGQECVMYALEWDFIGGSFGVVEGQKLVQAAKEAEKRGLPLVTVYSTGGARQEENFGALIQMQLAVAAVDKLKKDKEISVVSVLLGQVWGGASASTVPMGDVLVGVEGTNFGFAGPNVIGAFEGQNPPPGSQSVESNYLRRQVDVVVEKTELYEYLGTYLRVTDTKSKVKDVKLSNLEKALKWDAQHAEDRKRIIKLRGEGFSPALYDNQRKLDALLEVEFPEPEAVDVDSESPDNLYRNYELIQGDVGRPDTEFLFKTIFDEVVPMYNHFTRENKIEYPALITAYAKLEGQTFLVVGNQVSYRVYENGRITQILSTPTPEDFDRVKEHMDIAAERGIPVISFVNTLGARPRLNDEYNGQGKRISQCLRAFTTHPAITMSVVTGGLGSGGGIAITSSSPVLFMLDYAQIWAAEPKSGASIVYGTNTPSKEQVKEFMSRLKCSAKAIKNLGSTHTGSKKEHGLPVHIIPSGATAHSTSRNIAHTLREAYQMQRKMSPSEIKALRHRVLDEMVLHLIQDSKM